MYAYVTYVSRRDCPNATAVRPREGTLALKQYANQRPLVSCRLWGRGRHLCDSNLTMLECRIDRAGRGHSIPISLNIVGQSLATQSPWKRFSLQGLYLVNEDSQRRVTNTQSSVSSRRTRGCFDLGNRSRGLGDTGANVWSKKRGLILFCFVFQLENGSLCDDESLCPVGWNTTPPPPPPQQNPHKLMY